MIADRDLKELAKRIGIAPGAAQRMLGSVPVELPERKSSSAKIDLGFRVLKMEHTEGELPLRLDVSELEPVFVEYRTACPLVVSWLVSGNFDPTKIPERINRASVIHASRTVGRLRAKYLRSAKRAFG